MPRWWHSRATITALAWHCKLLLNSPIHHRYDTLLQGSDLVFLGGDELLPNEAFIACLHKSLDDSRIIKFLRLVDFRTSRATSGMDMGEVLIIFPDILDDIPSMICI